MSLHDAIQAANKVFFDPVAGFAEQVTYIPQGVLDDEFDIDGVVDWDNEEGNNQMRGEGRSSLNQDHGRTTRGSIQVELPTTRKTTAGATVAMVVNENGKDRIVVTRHGSGETVTLVVKRILARDEAAQLVLCHTETEHMATPRKTRFG